MKLHFFIFERLRIYKTTLERFELSTNRRRGLCVNLLDTADRMGAAPLSNEEMNTSNILSFFPEIRKQRPLLHALLGGNLTYWWPCNEAGDEKRRAALRKAIDECEKKLGKIGRYLNEGAQQLKSQSTE
jgi:hypothetical protein